ncbi:hypothetical protein [Rhodoflexus caldus]|uniref:hypothetical protein n=1 Tax=Rhodoflexus caldus TaxID=2891236 RepID=UPI002029DEF9|nr:hypothetical protein [Rhodoflexus caldus]
MKQLLRNQVLLIALLSFFAFGCSKESDPAPPSPAEQLAAQLVQGTWQISTLQINGQLQVLTNQDRAMRYTYRLGTNKTSGKLTWTTAQNVIEADWRLTDPTTLVISGGGDQVILTEVKITDGLLSYVELDGNTRYFFILRRV